jgi:endonuclease I
MLLQAPAASVSTPKADAYFSSVAGKHGQELGDGLRSIWNQTDRPLDYRGARDQMFPKLGRAEGQMWMEDLYTGQQLVGVKSRASANENHVNTEHLWPQSQGATERLRSDLHHLQATKQDVNEYRWHLPFGAVVDAQDGAAAAGANRTLPANSGSVGFDKDGRLVYEPRDAVKGVIARSLMYVYERYGAGTEHPFGFKSKEFSDSLPTLLAWNAAHLPDAAELRRNDMIQSIQGTRNYFVDHPEAADELMAGVATKADAPAPREQQLSDWVNFLKDPSQSWKNATPEHEAASKARDNANWKWTKHNQKAQHQRARNLQLSA